MYRIAVLAVPVPKTEPCQQKGEDFVSESAPELPLIGVWASAASG